MSHENISVTLLALVAPEGEQDTILRNLGNSLLINKA
jgi:hypothetical protein